MQINIIAIGKKMPAWIEEGFLEYSKRMPKELNINLIELPLAKSSSKTSPEQLMDQEGKAILAAIPEKNNIIALDVKGKSFSTEQLAHQLQLWRENSRDISIIIGGPNGLSKEVLAAAETKWSLSTLTFPHPLVRVILAEQLYRAISYLAGHPYHRA
jgi:23S rRNA (pseudouridine1915-N3)-methyltransferase